jgi:hypothetical protein
LPTVEAVAAGLEHRYASYRNLKFEFRVKTKVTASPEATTRSPSLTKAEIETRPGTNRSTEEGCQGFADAF